MMQLDPRIRTVWRIRYALTTLVLLMGALAFDLARLLGGNGWLPPGLLTIATLLIGATTIWLVPRLRYDAWRYVLDEDELRLEYGVLTRVKTVVPLRRVQHLDVSRGILEREFGLGRFIVHTAGTRASVVVVPGLEIDEANRLHDRVKTYVLQESD